MDKYQRKQLRRRDEMHGKLQDEFQRLMDYGFRTEREIRDLHKVERALRDYVPKCTMTLREMKDVVVVRWRWQTIQSRRSYIRRPGIIHVGPFTFPEPDVIEEGDIKRSIQRGKALADEKYTLQIEAEFTTSLSATRKFREELIDEYPRWRAILNCKAIKEELMAAAWHPDRISRILELGGFEALDNFAGL